MRLCRGYLPVALLAVAMLLTQAASAETVTGRIGARWGDPAAGSGHFMWGFTTSAGAQFEIEVSEELLAAAGGRQGLDRRLATLELDDNLRSANGSRVVNDIRLIEEPNRRAIETGAKKWVSLACRFNDIATEQKTQAFFQGMYNTAQRGELAHLWNEVAHGTLDMSSGVAHDWVNLGANRTDFDWSDLGQNDLDPLLALCVTAHCNAGNGPFTDAYGMNIFLNGEMANAPSLVAWGGTATADKNCDGNIDGFNEFLSVTWEGPWGYSNQTVMAHETGHGFGLPHADNGDGDNNVYDNPWDVMSNGGWDQNPANTYGKLGVHTVTYHKEIKGWLSGTKIATTNRAATVTLAPAHLLNPDSCQAVKIPAGTNRFLYVESRDTAAGTYDEGLPARAVVIHEVVTTRQDPAKLVDPDGDDWGSTAASQWVVGETYNDTASGISVAVTGTAGNGYAVSITGVTTQGAVTCMNGGNPILTVNKNGTGTGTVTSNPAGINCGGDCTEGYVAGTQVTLTAAPDNGNTFTGWSGGGCNGTGTCQVTVNAATSVTATFDAAGGGQCTGAVALTCNTPTNGSLVGAPSNLDGYSCAGSGQSGGERVYSLMAPSSGNITVDLTSLTSDTDLFVMSSAGGCNPTNCLGGSENIDNAAEQVVFNATAGQTYYIAVEDWSDGASSYTLQATCAGGNASIFTDGFESGNTSAWSAKVP